VRLIKHIQFIIIWLLHATNCNEIVTEIVTGHVVSRTEGNDAPGPQATAVSAIRPLTSGDNVRRELLVPARVHLYGHRLSPARTLDEALDALLAAQSTPG
jgi:hypothetical protein